MGNDINFFVTSDLKSYTPSKDQSIFGRIKHLSIHILTMVGLGTQLVMGHIEVTKGIAPYLFTPPLQSQNMLTSTTPNQPKQSIVPSSTTLSNASRLKQLVSPKKDPTTKEEHKPRVKLAGNIKHPRKVKLPRKQNPQRSEKSNKVYL